mgnify:CR=1 FL=1
MSIRVLLSCKHKVIAEGIVSLYGILPGDMKQGLPPIEILYSNSEIFRLVAEAIYRRLTTPPGTLLGGDDEANYGLDLLSLIGSVEPARLVAAWLALLAMGWASSRLRSDHVKWAVVGAPTVFIALSFGSLHSGLDFFLDLTPSASHALVFFSAWSGYEGWRTKHFADGAAQHRLAASLHPQGRLHEACLTLRMAPAADRDAFLGELLDAFGLEAAPRLARSVERRLLDLEVRVREELGRAGERLVDEERSRP